MNTDRNVNELKSPCVRNCCLDKKDICLGCFRSLDEIVGWYTSSQEEKENILSRCKKRRASLKNR